MRRLLPDPASEIDLAAAYYWPPDVRLRACMIASLDGAIAGADGRSGSLSGPADRELLLHLRRGADAVLVGAATVRTEAYRPASVPTVVVSGRLDLDPGSALFTGPAPVVILTVEDADPDRMLALAAVADIAVAGEATLDLSQGLELLAELGMRRLLCEGGPRLLGSLATADLLDELCLTTAPVIVGGSGPRLLAAGLFDDDRRFTPTDLFTDDGFLFARYRRTP